MQKLAKTGHRIRVARFATKVKKNLRCQRNRAQVLSEHLSLKLRLHKYCLCKNFKPVYLGRRWLLRQRLKTIFIFVDSWTKSARRFVTGKHC
jgi:hypothetical protein